MNRPTAFPPAHGVGFPSRRWADAADRTNPEARQRRGKLLVVVGWITAMVGVAVYCAASFAADASADLAGLLRGVPAARAGFLVIGAGTLIWAVGSVMHLNAALDAPEATDAPQADQAGNPGPLRRDP